MGKILTAVVVLLWLCSWFLAIPAAERIAARVAKKNKVLHQVILAAIVLFYLALSIILGAKL
jgi:uncharacterized membrane protein